MAYSLRIFAVMLLLCSTLVAKEFQLAALIVDGVEGNAIFFQMENNETYLERDVLSDIPDVTIDDVNDTITTPIGTVSLSSLFKNSPYPDTFTLTQLDKVLKIRAEYSSKYIALFLQTPWSHTRGRRSRKSKVADILPASNLLNGIRLDTTTEYWNEQFKSTAALQLTGRVLDGITRVSALQVQDEDAYINEMFWLKSEDRYSLLLGLQNTQPHQLLPYEEMNGVQAVWTNYDMPDTSGRVEATLRPSLGPDNRIVTGKGPIGGSVVLMVNDKATIAERIRLDGTYRIDISQQNLSSAPLVELWVYERDPVGAPIEKLDLNYLKLPTLLEKGQISLLGGVGQSGNTLGLDDKSDNSETVANIYARYGVSDGLTLEGGVMQDADKRNYAMVAATASLGTHLTLHGALSSQEDLIASYATLNGRWDSDYLTVRLQSEPENYRGVDSDREDAYIDYTKKITETLSLGFSGRYHRDNDDNVSFLLPTVRYRPLDSLSLTLMPNYDGYYRFSATYIPEPNLRFNYIFEEEEHRLSIVDNITDEWSLYFDGLSNMHDKDRYEAGASWRSEDRNDLYFEAGAIYSEDKIGFKANMRHNLLPGVYAKYEVRHEPYIESDSKSYASINLIADFGIIQGNFHPTKAPESDRSMRGYIVGNVYINGTKTRIESEDIKLLINNSPINGGESSGRFFVENLKEGVYTVKLDAASLPMEYSPVKSSYNIKVSDGAVSTVDFYVDTFYGFAGKLHRSKSEDPVEIILTSKADEKEYTAYTDQFDYYRFDSIPPGAYLLSVLDHNLKVSAVKVVIKDDFLFDKDLFVKE